MPKRVLDTTITNSIKTVVSGSFADNVVMLNHKNIKAHDENFYSISEIELLADDIERQGLKSNLVVREDIHNKGHYVIISGHRRHKAIEMLIEQNRYDSSYVPCLINPAKGDADELQDLIMLNATTRVISDKDMIAQYEKLRAILDSQKATGENIRMRDTIAERLNVSKGKVAMIERVAKDKEAKKSVESGKMSLYKADLKLKDKENHTLTNLSTTKKATMSRSKILTPDNIDIESIHSKTRDEINEICDSGFFNDIIVGYVIIALEELGVDLKSMNIESLFANDIFYKYTAEDARNRV